MKVYNETALQEIYESMCASFYKHPFKTKASEVPLFKDLARMLSELNIDPYEYFKFLFPHMKGKFHLSYLASREAVERFEYHRKLKNLYVNDLYSLKEDYLYVTKTFKKYSLTQVNSSLTADPDANWALNMAEKNEVPTSKKRAMELRDCVEYTLCKFLYKNKPLPINFMKFRRLLWEENRSD